MELQFEDNEYYLVDENNVTIASTDKLLLKHDSYMKKLSRRNCDTIKNGYDLDQFAREECNNPDLSWENELAEEKFKKGFIKALELNKDKLFTVETEWEVDIEPMNLDENNCLLLKKKIV